MKFDFAAFDSEITRELKENSMFYDPEIDDLRPMQIGAVLAVPSVEITEVPELTE